MKRWTPRWLFAGSLRRFLLLWLLGGLLLIVGLVTLWQAERLHSQHATAQDERLAAALAALVQQAMDSGTLAITAPSYTAMSAATTSANTSANASVTNPREMQDSILRPISYRISAMNGDWLAGEQALPPCPWRARLVVGGAPDFYVAQLRGQLVRVAAAVRHLPAAGNEAGDRPVVVQAAAPLAERLPTWNLLWHNSLAPMYAAAAALAALIWAGVVLGTNWMARVRRVLDKPQEQPGAYDGPAELQPLVAQVQQFFAEQHHWVDEQRRFLADASHQLRTPMAVLRTQLQSAIAGDTALDEVLPQMLHTVDRATGLVNQLLSLTKLEQLKRRGELKAIDVRAVARDAVLELAPLIAAKRIEFALDEAELVAPADATMLGELVRNLLANAIHHAPPGGRVGIVLREGAQQLELIVWDEGPGIDDALRPRLFHPFAASQGGVGLGLSICRQIAESMGASIELYNRSANGLVIGVDAVVAWGQGP